MRRCKKQIGVNAGANLPRTYEFAIKYFTMGDGGQLPRLRQRGATARRSWSAGSVKYDWVEQDGEPFFKQDEEKWAQRERERREKLFAIPDAMLARAKTILDCPLFKTPTTKVDEGGRHETTNVHPAGWTLSTAARLVPGAPGCAATAQASQHSKSTADRGRSGPSSNGSNHDGAGDACFFPGLLRFFLRRAIPMVTPLPWLPQPWIEARKSSWCKALRPITSGAITRRETTTYDGFKDKFNR
jgi:hypothetical protein